MILASASRLPLYGECRAAGALPQIDRRTEDAAIGNAVHEHMQLRVELGVDDAVAALPEIARRWELSDVSTAVLIARCKDFEWTPPAGALVEVPLCLFEDGHVERVVGGRGKYERLPPGALLPGTADAIWSEPEPLDLSDPARPRCRRGSVLWVTDYKGGGDAWVSPVEKNWQARANTLAAAIWTGAELAVPAICFVRPGKGEWDVPRIPLDRRALDVVHRETLELLADVAEQRRRLAAGEPLSFVEGRHCQVCGAEAQCGAKTAAMKAMLGDLSPLGDSPLSPAQAATFAARLAQIEAFAKRAREALVAHVQANGPIDIGGGLSWGPVPRSSSRIDGKLAQPILDQELGPGSFAATVKLTKTALSDAAKRLGRHASRRLFARLRAAGAIRQDTETQFRVHRIVEDGGEATALAVADIDAIDDLSSLI